MIIFWVSLYLILFVFLFRFVFNPKHHPIRRFFIFLASLILLGMALILIFYRAPEPCEVLDFGQYALARDGVRLNTKYVAAIHQLPTTPTILWLHGWAEHSARYHDLAHYVAQHGYASILYDHRGHGRSGGPRGYIDYFDQYIEDLESIYAYHKSKIGGPLFVVGHSMGGLIAIRLLESERNFVPVRAAVLSSPLLGIKVYVPQYKKMISKVFHKVFPRLMVPRGGSARCTTHDKELAAHYEKDPFVFFHATPGWYEAVTQELEYAMEDSAKIKVPLHILMAGDDHIVDVQKTKEFHSRIACECAGECELYPEMYHEIFNEVDREKPRKKLLAILSQYWQQ